jgi:hypothetical protein
MPSLPRASWTLREGVLVLEDADLRVTIQAQSGDPIGPCSLPGSDFLLFEWVQYNIVSTQPLEAVEELGAEARRLSGSDGTATLLFRNRVGRAVIRIRAGSRELPACRAEVLSPKLPTEEEHQAFLTTLLHDLTTRTQTATFVTDAATAFAAEADPRGPTTLSRPSSMPRIAS